MKTCNRCHAANFALVCIYAAIGAGILSIAVAFAR